MGGRFIISGAQIGMLQALLRIGDTERAVSYLNEIYENQFLGESHNALSEDASQISRLFYPTNKLKVKKPQIVDRKV